ncbi:beta-aspartyl-peptidase [Sulfobacillus harzensis]|uniref:Isoaspartyl dipeptidase n=1 Tax=Sulfobacillus harzensis TaxID=2729629 RepID=A0A7Y0Q332_9FIRM|nr:beta-aspartyl-peptidase [Sulfobacillus harzensis]NMP22985.1 beta-aspartyl-peptidase [Sulfobacillus harzensis]
MTVTATLIRQGEVYDPNPRGRMDILTVGSQIVAMGHDLAIPDWAEGTVIAAEGLMVFPGLVDQHVHFAGGGGEGGPQFRTPELSLTELTRFGLTTVVGILGTDGTSRSVQSLLAKARALVAEGLNAWIYTGAYQVPTRTITDTPRSDIILIDRILGVGEIAISDHRGSHPSDRELAQLAGEARTGGLLSGKAGVVHLHVGSGARRLEPLFEVIKMADIPIAVLVPTHLNRTRDLLADAVRWGLMGGYCDITSSIEPDAHDHHAVSPVEAVETLRAAGVRHDRISFSTDAGGSAPVFNAEGELLHMGVGMPDSLFKSVAALKEELRLTWTEALLPATKTPATILKLDGIAGIEPGFRADLMVTDGRHIRDLIAGGRVMVRDGHPVVYGTFEKSEGDTR